MRTVINMLEHVLNFLLRLVMCGAFMAAVIGFIWLVMCKPLIAAALICGAWAVVATVNHGDDPIIKL